MVWANVKHWDTIFSIYIDENQYTYNDEQDTYKKDLYTSRKTNIDFDIIDNTDIASCNKTKIYQCSNIYEMIVKEIQYDIIKNRNSKDVISEGKEQELKENFIKLKTLLLNSP